MKILLTAFKPFGGERVNPAMEAVLRVTGEDVIKLYLPVEYETAAKLVLGKLSECKPDAVLCVGQAGGRTGVTPENCARNLRDSASPDSAGRLCRSEPVVPGAPEMLYSTFDAGGMTEYLKDKGFPAYASSSAGTYVCNDVFYSVMYALGGTHVPAGFIHVPFCTEQLADHPQAFALSTDEITAALEAALDFIRMKHKKEVNA